jgi:hypothetical protein
MVPWGAKGMRTRRVKREEVRRLGIKKPKGTFGERGE